MNFSLKITIFVENLIGNVAKSVIVESIGASGAGLNV